MKIKMFNDKYSVWKNGVNIDFTNDEVKQLMDFVNHSKGGKNNE